MKKLIAAVLASIVMFSTTAFAYHESCYDLWYRKHSIWKDAGLCFKDASTIQTFGNAGCMYDDAREVPLSAYQRQEMKEIDADRRAQGCIR